MDEQALRAAFEAKHGRRPIDDPQLEATWDDRLECWLACYQHLAPMVRMQAMDDAIKACNEVDIIGADDCIEKIRALKDTAREQEKKTCSQ